MQIPEVLSQIGCVKVIKRLWPLPRIPVQTYAVLGFLAYSQTRFLLVLRFTFTHNSSYRCSLHLHRDDDFAGRLQTSPCLDAWTSDRCEPQRVHFSSLSLAAAAACHAAGAGPFKHMPTDWSSA